MFGGKGDEGSGVVLRVSGCGEASNRGKLAALDGVC